MPEAREKDHDRADDDPDRPEQVRQELQVGAFEIQTLGGPSPKQPEGEEVDDQTHRGDRQHGSAGDLRRVPEPFQRLEQHVERHPGQEQAVDHRSEHLEPVHPVGPSPQQSLRELDHHQGQPQTEDVGAHVRGIADHVNDAVTRPATTSTSA